MIEALLRSHTRALLTLALLLVAPAPLAAVPATRADAWNELPPPARTQHVAVFDTKRKRMIVFGGSSDGHSYRNDLWTLRRGPAAQWDRIQPIGEAPSPRAGAAALYDPARDRMLVFGGTDGFHGLNDLWELTLGGQPRWRRLLASSTDGPAGVRATLTLEPSRDCALVIGGWNSSWLARTTDVWEVSLSEPPGWKRLVTTGPPPPGRAGHVAVWVPERGSILVMGGAPEDPESQHIYGAPRSDAWWLSLDPQPRWTDATGEMDGAIPCGMRGQVAAYDPAQSRVVVCGGTQSWDACPTSDPRLWSLSLRGMTWSRLDFEGAVPRPRWNASGVVDPDRRSLWMFGGESGWPGIHSDAWALALEGHGAWSRLPSDGENPPGLDGIRHGMVIDPPNDRLVVCGLSGVWTYPLCGPGNWRALEPKGEAPGWDGLREHVGDVTVVYDDRRHRLVVQSAFPKSGATWVDTTGTWTLTLDSSPTWTSISAAEPTPLLFVPDAIYDPVRDRMLLAGSLHDDPEGLTWWSLPLGTSGPWTREASPAWPPDLAVLEQIPRHGHVTAYDSRRDAVLVHAGGFPWSDGWNAFGDSWKLPLTADSAWVPAADNWCPRPGVFEAAVIDPMNDRLIQFGGFRPGPWGDGPYGEVWALTLGTGEWSRLDQGSDEPVWAAPLAAYDAKRHRVLVLEGNSLWEMTLGSRARPGLDRRSQPLAEAPSARVPALELLTPNPSRAAWSVAVRLSDAPAATLHLHDLAGRRVWEASIGRFGPGRHVLAIAEGTTLGAGVYFLTLSGAGEREVLKLVRLE